MEFHSPEISMQMIALGLLILAAHLGGRLARRLHLSEVTGQLIGGAVVSPYALHAMKLLDGAQGGAYDDAIHAFHFFVFIFLGMVAFGIGEELHISRIRQVGRAALSICLVQAAATWIVISGTFYIVPRLGIVGTPMPLAEALLIGSIGIATAPAVTFVLMNQMWIEGRLRHILGSIVVLDDLIEVIIFSVLIQWLLQAGTPHLGGEGVFLPVVRDVALALLLGGAIYLLLRILVRRNATSLHSEDEKDDSHGRDALLWRLLATHPSPSAEILLLVMGAIGLGAGLAYYFHWPFLITAMFAGFLVANLHSHAIFDSLKIQNITPVLNLGFFALIGANIDLGSLEGGALGLSVVYIIARLTGKVYGTWLGCRLLREDRKVTMCLPSLMLPQAGVAAVEAVYASVLLGRPDIGAIILPSVVFFEIAGVLLVNRGLRRWRSWEVGEENAMRPSAGVTNVGDAARLLLVYIQPSSVNLNLHGATKREVIESLVEHAQHATDQHIDQEQALQLVGERELLAPTAFGNGVAMPHCRLIGIDRPVVVLGRHATGVDYGAPGEPRYDLFLLLLTCAWNPAEHLQLLAAAAHILHDARLREELRDASDPEAVVAILRRLAER